MNLTITTPSSKNDYSVVWIEVNTPTGNYILQQGHVPTIMSLSPHKDLIFRLKTGKQQAIAVAMGIIKITRDAVIVVMTPS